MSFQYRGLEAKFERYQVTDADVDEQIARLRRQNAKRTVVESRPARKGDEVVLDYAGFCNGEQFAGGTAKNQTLELGSGTFIPGFEEQLMGKKVGEPVTVDVTFPRGYHAAKLDGQNAQFQCVIHEIREKTPYALDDEFAREVGGCETYAEMQEKIAYGLQLYADKNSEIKLQDKLLQMAADTLETEIAPQELQRVTEEYMDSLRNQMTRQGATLEQFCQSQNMTMEQLRNDAQEAARASIRNQEAVTRIAEMENLDATEEELEQARKLVCRQNGLTLKQLKAHSDENLERTLRQTVLTTKAMRLIYDAAVIIKD